MIIKQGKRIYHRDSLIVIIIGMHQDLTLVSTDQVSLEKSQIQLAAKFLNIEVIFETSAKPYKQSAFVEKHPFGAFPILKTTDGILCTTNSILKYLARKGKNMYGKNLVQHTEIDQVLDFCMLELSPIIKAIQEAITGAAPLTKRVYKLYLLEIKKIMNNLNERMKVRQWLAGMYISIADVALMPSLNYTYSFLLPASERAKLPFITSWYLNMSHATQFKSIFGNICFCQLPQTPAKYIFEYIESSEQHLNDQIESKKEQKIQFSNWLDKIKYQMLNYEDKKEVIATMIKQFDSTIYSIFKIEYQNYSNQCSEEIRAINMRSSILSHLEGLRNQTFAVTGVYGSENSGFQIKGIWLFNQPHLPLAWETHPLYNYHSYNKLNHDNKCHCDILEQYWLGMEPGTMAEGKMPVVTAKYFA